MCSRFIVGNKFFYFFKKWVFAFFVNFKGGSQVLQNFEGVAHKGGGRGGVEGGGGRGLTDLEYFFWGEARWKGVRSIFQGQTDTLEDTMKA